MMPCGGGARSSGGGRGGYDGVPPSVAWSDCVPNAAPSRAIRPGGAESRSQGAVVVLCVALGGRSPAQGVVGVPFRAHGEAASSYNRAHRPNGNGESSPGGGRSILQGPWGGGIVQEPGTPALGGRGVQPRGWSEYPSGPMGRQHRPRTGHTGLGGTGSPAQGVVEVSFWAHGEAALSKNRAHRPGGDGESSPRGGRSILQGPWGGSIIQEPGTPASGVGESSPGGGRSVLYGPWGGGGGTRPPDPVTLGLWEAAAREARAHWLGEDSESCPGGGRGALQGRWGGSPGLGPPAERPY